MKQSEKERRRIRSRSRKNMRLRITNRISPTKKQVLTNIPNRMKMFEAFSDKARHSQNVPIIDLLNQVSAVSRSRSYKAAKKILGKNQKKKRAKKGKKKRRKNKKEPSSVIFPDSIYYKDDDYLSSLKLSELRKINQEDNRHQMEGSDIDMNDNKNKNIFQDFDLGGNRRVNTLQNTLETPEGGGKYMDQIIGLSYKKNKSAFESPYSKFEPSDIPRLSDVHPTEIIDPKNVVKVEVASPRNTIDNPRRMDFNFNDLDKKYPTSFIRKIGESPTKRLVKKKKKKIGKKKKKGVKKGVKRRAKSTIKGAGKKKRRGTVKKGKSKIGKKKSIKVGEEDTVRKMVDGLSREFLNNAKDNSTVVNSSLMKPIYKKQVSGKAKKKVKGKIPKVRRDSLKRKSSKTKENFQKKSGTGDKLEDDNNNDDSFLALMKLGSNNNGDFLAPSDQRSEYSMVKIKTNSPQGSFQHISISIKSSIKYSSNQLGSIRSIEINKLDLEKIQNAERRKSTLNKEKILMSLRSDEIKMEEDRSSKRLTGLEDNPDFEIKEKEKLTYQLSEIFDGNARKDSVNVIKPEEALTMQDEKVVHVSKIFDVESARVFGIAEAPEASCFSNKLIFEAVDEAQIEFRVNEINPDIGARRGSDALSRPEALGELSEMMKKASEVVKDDSMTVEDMEGQKDSALAMQNDNKKDQEEDRVSSIEDRLDPELVEEVKKEEGIDTKSEIAVEKNDQQQVEDDKQNTSGVGLVEPEGPEGNDDKEIIDNNSDKDLEESKKDAVASIVKSDQDKPDREKISQNLKSSQENIVKDITEIAIDEEETIPYKIQIQEDEPSIKSVKDQVQVITEEPEQEQEQQPEKKAITNNSLDTPAESIPTPKQTDLESPSKENQSTVTKSKEHKDTSKGESPPSKEQVQQGHASNSQTIPSNSNGTEDSLGVTFKHPPKANSVQANRSKIPKIEVSHVYKSDKEPSKTIDEASPHQEETNRSRKSPETGEKLSPEESEKLTQEQENPINSKNGSNRREFFEAGKQDPAMDYNSLLYTSASEAYNGENPSSRDGRAQVISLRNKLQKINKQEDDHSSQK